MGTTSSKKRSRRYVYLSSLGGQYKSPIGVSTRDGDARVSDEYSYRFPGNGMRDEGRLLAELAAKRDDEGDNTEPASPQLRNH